MVNRVSLKKDGKKPGGDVGYGRPPKHGQFKPGQSGNPKGRPKGAKNFKTVVRQTLHSMVKVNKNGRATHLSTQHASLAVLVAKALGGDLRALEKLLRFAEKYDEPTIEANAPVSDTDQMILDAFVKRLKDAGWTEPGTQ